MKIILAASTFILFSWMLSVIGFSAEILPNDTSPTPLTASAPFSSQTFSQGHFFPSFAARNFQDFIRPNLSSSPRTESKDDWSTQEALELEYRRIRFSLYRFTLHPSQRLLIRPSDIDKQKQDLIQALPSTLRSAPLQDSIETVGKIIEPGFNIKVEF